jgi:hypothetical protein
MPLKTANVLHEFFEGAQMPCDPTKDDERYLIVSADEMQCTLTIAKAVEAARRRGGESRGRIAETLLVLAGALVDGEPEAAQALIVAAGRLMQQLQEHVVDAQL